MIWVTTPGVGEGRQSFVLHGGETEEEIIHVFTVKIRVAWSGGQGLDMGPPHCRLCFRRGNRRFSRRGRFDSVRQVFGINEKRGPILLKNLERSKV